MSRDLNRYNLRRYLPRNVDGREGTGGEGTGGEGFKEYLTEGSRWPDGDESGGGMKNLLVYNLLRHPKTSIADPRPKIVKASEFNETRLKLTGSGTGGGEKMPEISYLIRREMIGGARVKAKDVDCINCLEHQERLGQAINKNDVVLVTGGWQLDKAKDIQSQLERNLDGEVLLLRNMENIGKFLNDWLIGEKGWQSQYQAVILDNIQRRTVEIDLLLYLFREYFKGGGSEGVKLVLVSNGIQNKDIVDYFGTGVEVGVVQLLRKEKERIAVYNDFEIGKDDWEDLSDDGDFWELLLNRIYLAVQKILIGRLEDDDKVVGNILVYLPNSYSIHRCQKYLQSRLGDSLKKFKVVTGKESSGKERGIYLMKDLGDLGRDVGEMDYVIDSGLQVIKNFDSQKRIHHWRLDHVTDVQAKERMAGAKRGVFKLYRISSLLDKVEPEIRRSPELGKWIIKMMVWGADTKTKVKELFMEELLSPVSLGRFLDSWEYMEKLKLVDRKGEERLQFLAKDCFRPLDLSLELCSVLLMGRNLIEDQKLLADVVAVLHYGGSVSGQWIFEEEERNRYSNPAGDVFGLVQWLRDEGEGEREGGKKENVQRFSERIQRRLERLDEKCVIELGSGGEGDDVVVLLNILKKVYGGNTVVFQDGVGRLEDEEEVQFKSGLLDFKYAEGGSGVRILPLELKKMDDFRDSEDGGILYGNQVINLEYGW